MPESRLALWKKSLRDEEELARELPTGVLSYEGHPIAEVVREHLRLHARPGNCLDLGCGSIAKPGYMCDGLDFIGVDPCHGWTEREFDFAQAVGEYLPFKSETFDNVLLATSIDHVIDPHTVMAEVCRVLKPGGKLFIWYTPYPPFRWARWRVVGGMFDKHHLWGFTRASMKALLRRGGFAFLDETRLRNSDLVTAKKVKRSQADWLSMGTMIPLAFLSIFTWPLFLMAWRYWMVENDEG